MEEFFYRSKNERDAIIAKQEALGQTMLHDDFSVGPNGEHRLTFEARNDPLPPPPRDYEAELDAARDLAEVKAVMKDYIGRR